MRPEPKTALGIGLVWLLLGDMPIHARRRRARRSAPGAGGFGIAIALRDGGAALPLAIVALPPSRMALAALLDGVSK